MPSLQQYSTFGLNASCTFISSFSDVSSFLSLYQPNIPTYILGGGSNSIFIDDFEGIVLVNEITGITHYDTDAYHFLRVGAGENWHDFVALCMQNQWYGLENLALIPGSVGASPIQNIGAYGKEVNAFIDTVEVVMLDSGDKALLSNQDCAFGYRDSIFKHELAEKVLITHVNFKLPKNNVLEVSYGELSSLEDATPERVFEKVIEIRQSKLPDPSVLGNAGSFFKNPVVPLCTFEKIKKQYNNVPHFLVDVSDEVAQQSSESIMVKVPAAWLIDQAGFKGKVHNKVRCHPTQPLVLTNLGNARGEDVIALAKEIITRISELFAIKLEPEVRLIGSEGLITL